MINFILDRWADFTNGGFELAGAAFQWVNVRKLWVDKRVRGVSIPAWVVFTLWGFWNLYYYPFLGQWASFVAGLVMTVGNTVWLILAIKYWGE